MPVLHALVVLTLLLATSTSLIVLSTYYSNLLVVQYGDSLLINAVFIPTYYNYYIQINTLGYKLLS
jgi:hypothetical protein